MNIFVLDECYLKCAKYHCDKHVVKMILETGQLLCTAHRTLDGEDAHPDLYKATHVNHPCAVWVRKSTGNYRWTYYLFLALLQEYTNRYKKHHKTGRFTDVLCLPPKNIPDAPQSQFVQCMPDQYKRIDPVEAYRAYYKGEKAYFAKWAHGPTPEWWD